MDGTAIASTSSVILDKNTERFLKVVMLEAPDGRNQPYDRCLLAYQKKLQGVY
jgi:hypothetical protein